MMTPGDQLPESPAADHASWIERRRAPDPGAADLPQVQPAAPHISAGSAEHSDSVSDDGAPAGADFLFCELNIDSPLVEFRRTCAKKMDAFTLSPGEHSLEVYRKAAALGEQVLQRLFGESNR